MPTITPNEYELLVSRLLEEQLPHDENTAPLTIYHKRKYKGASGQQYEIDLSFEVTFANTRVLFLVECKCYKHLIRLDEIAEFAYKLHDIGAHKEIVVTTVGFQEGAVNVAKQEGIALVRAVEASWYKILADERIHICTSNMLPAMRYSTKNIDKKTDCKQIFFLPWITGFIGDPMNFWEAVKVFFVEMDMSDNLICQLPRPQMPPPSGVLRMF